MKMKTRQKGQWSLFILGVSVLGLPAMTGFVGRQSSDAGELRVTVDEATFAIRHLQKDRWAVATRGNKLLVLKYTVRNPGNYPLEYSQETVALSLIRDGKRTSLSMSSPNALSTLPFMQIPARGSVQDSVTIEVPNDETASEVELRIGNTRNKLDLRNRVRTDFGPFLSVDGKAKDDVFGAYNERMPLGTWDVAIQSIQPATGRIHFNVVPSAEQSVFVVTLQATNVVNETQVLDASAFTAELTTEDGDKVRWGRMVLHAKDAEYLEQPVKPNGRTTGRYVFYVPKGERVAKVTFIDPSSGRTANIDLKRPPARNR